MTLQRSQIVAAALQLLNQDGLDGVTVRKVASHLNVHVGGLYWHVKNKRDLLDEMANTILAEEFVTVEPPERGQSWAEWLASERRAGVDVYAYFNNDIGGHAPRDAVRLRERLERAT